MENELKKKDELSTITLIEVTREIEKINNTNNDKENKNKKLIKDNQHLISIIEDKSKEKKYIYIYIYTPLDRQIKLEITSPSFGNFTYCIHDIPCLQHQVQYRMKLLT